MGKNIHTYSLAHATPYQPSGSLVKYQTGNIFILTEESDSDPLNLIDIKIEARIYATRVSGSGSMWGQNTNTLTLSGDFSGTVSTSAPFDMASTSPYFDVQTVTVATVSREASRTAYHGSATVTWYDGTTETHNYTLYIPCKKQNLISAENNRRITFTNNNVRYEVLNYEDTI